MNVRRQLGFRDDPAMRRAVADEGTPEWAEYIRSKLQKAVDKQTISAIEFTSFLDAFFRNEAWRVLVDAYGKPFPSFRSFAVTPQPHGLGCSKDVYTRLMAARRTPQEVLAEAEPQRTHSDAAASQVQEGTRGFLAKEKNVPDNIRNAPKYGTDPDYLAGRIKKKAETDAVAADVAARIGEFPSMRAAALAAGVLKAVPPAERVRRGLRKLSPPERLTVVIEAIAELPAAQLNELIKAVCGR